MSPKPIDKQVSAREGYALWASHYDVHDNPMTTMVEHVLSQSSIDLRGAKVLELGCGTGRNARTLLNSGVGSYLGLDSSPEMLEVAGAAACDVIQFKERDLQGHWWTGLESFDLCLISLVLEHFENIEEVINAATHVVRPGGLLWILEIHSQLRGEGVQAHVTSDTQTLALPSFEHPAAEFVSAFHTKGWESIASTDWFATQELGRRCSKLNRYLGRPVLLECRAQRLA